MTKLLVFQTRRKYWAIVSPSVRWTARECDRRFHDNITRPVSSSCLGVGVGVEQAVQMDDEIAHVRIVDRLLRLGLPGAVGRGIIGIDADDVELGEILELGVVELRQFAAEHEMR